MNPAEERYGAFDLISTGGIAVSRSRGVPVESG